LDKKLGMLETHQKDIHGALVSIENEASRLYTARAFPLSFMSIERLVVTCQ